MSVGGEGIQGPGLRSLWKVETRLNSIVFQIPVAKVDVHPVEALTFYRLLVHNLHCAVHQPFPS